MFLLVSADSAIAYSVRLAEDVEAIGGITVFVTDAPICPLSNRIVLSVPRVPELFFPVMVFIPFALLAIRLGDYMASSMVLELIR